MLRRRITNGLAGLAVLASLAACAPANVDVSDDSARTAQAVGARLAQEDHRQALERRAEIAKAVRVDGLHVSEGDRFMLIVFVVHNLSQKPIARFDVAFEADASGGGRRIATTELHERITVGANASTTVSRRIPYTQFGDDTGPMREAAGKPQHDSVRVKWIRYSDASEAGYDD